MCVLKGGHKSKHMSANGHKWESTAFQIFDREEKLERKPTGAAANANEEVVRLRSVVSEMKIELDAARDIEKKHRKRAELLEKHLKIRDELLLMAYHWILTGYDSNVSVFLNDWISENIDANLVRSARPWAWVAQVKEEIGRVRKS
jgi:hypothetical protein